MRSVSVIATCLFALSPAVALAGECPEGKEGPTPFEVVTESKGEIDVKLNGEFPLAGQIPLTEESVAEGNWRMRSRSITFGAGAIASAHTHAMRPEIITILEGAVTIYAEDCTVGVEVKPGDIYRSQDGDTHWAVNEGDVPAVMFAVDVVDMDSFPVGEGDEHGGK